MQKKVKSKLSSFIFILICLLTFGLSLAYFFVTLNKTTVRNEKVIANIQFKKKIAQRKFSDSVVWERLQNGSPLYNEDIIRTDSEALADIIFPEQPVIVNIDENTLIQVFEGNAGQLKLNVSSGNFAIDTSEATETVTVDLGNGSILSLEQGTKMSASAQLDKKSFVIQQGSATVITSDGLEEVFLEGDSIKFDKDGNKKRIPVSVTNHSTIQKVLAPDNEKEKSVKLELRKTPDAVSEKIIVETSTDETFSEIAERKEISDPNVSEIEIKVDEPVMYYRVYTEEKKEDAFEGKFIVGKTQAPKLISPVDGSVFTGTYGIPDVFFSWDCGEYCDYVNLEVFSQDDMTKPVLTQNVTGRSISVNRFSEGKYFWRITPHYIIDDSEFANQTDLLSFKVVKEQINLKPVLSLPGEDSVITLDDKAKDVVFMWKSDMKNSTYLLEIADDADFTDIIYENKNISMRDIVPFAINTMPENKYFWRVTRIDEKNIGYKSQVRSFDVKKYIPSNTELVYPVDDFSAEADVVFTSQFLWRLSDKYDKDKTQSIVQFSDDYEFKNIINTVITDKFSATGISLDAGTYFWRIAAINKENGSELFKTESRKFTVLDKLEQPQINVPENDAVYNIADSKNIKLEWKQIDAADYYKVKVYDTETKAIITQIDEIKENKINLLLENVDSNSKYSFAVTAYTFEKENSPARMSKTDSVDVAFEKLQKVVLTSPVNGTKISGLTALHDGVSFKWNINKEAKDSHFILSRVYPNGTSKVVFTSKGDKGQVTVRKLTEGSYTWTVKAVSQNGSSLSPSRGFAFNVLKTEPLSSPVLQIPSNEFVIDMAYLKNNRTINFEWKMVEEATDYLFVLYQINENGIRRKIMQKKTSGTKVVFSDLKSLDIGTFEWHVTAYSHLKDGFEEQKSEEVFSSFRIDIGLPQGVETIDPGRMYGE